MMEYRQLRTKPESVVRGLLAVLFLCPLVVNSIPQNYRYKVNHVPGNREPYAWTGQVLNLDSIPLRTKFEPVEEYDARHNVEEAVDPVSEQKNTYQNPHVSYDIARLALNQNEQELSHIPIVVNPQSLLPGKPHNKINLDEKLSPIEVVIPYLTREDIYKGTDPISAGGPSSTSHVSQRVDSISSSISQGIKNTISSFAEQQAIRSDSPISNADIIAAVDSVVPGFPLNDVSSSTSDIVAPVAVVPASEDQSTIDTINVVAATVPVDDERIVPYPVHPTGANTADVDVSPIIAPDSSNSPSSPDTINVPAAIIPVGRYPIYDETNVPAAVVPGNPSENAEKNVPAAIIPVPGYPSTVNKPNVPSAVQPASIYPSNDVDGTVSDVTVPLPGSYPSGNAEISSSGANAPVSEDSSTSNKDEVAAAIVPIPGYPSGLVETGVPAVIAPVSEYPSSIRNPNVPSGVQPVVEPLPTDSDLQSQVNNKPVSLYPIINAPIVESGPSTTGPDVKPLDQESDVDNIGNSMEITTTDSISDQQSIEENSMDTESQSSVEVEDDQNEDSEEKLETQENDLNSISLNFGGGDLFSSSNIDKQNDEFQLFNVRRKRPSTLVDPDEIVIFTNDAADNTNDIINNNGITFTFSKRDTLEEAVTNPETIDVTTQVINTDTESDNDLETTSAPEEESTTTESSTTEDSSLVDQNELQLSKLMEADLEVQRTKFNFINGWNNEIFRRGLYFLRIGDVFPETGYVHMPDIESYTHYIQSTPNIQYYTFELLKAWRNAKENLKNVTLHTSGIRDSIAPNFFNINSQTTSGTLSGNDKAFIEGYNKLVAQYQPDRNKIHSLISTIPQPQSPYFPGQNPLGSAHTGSYFPQPFGGNLLRVNQNPATNTINVGNRPIPGSVTANLPPKRPSSHANKKP